MTALATVDHLFENRHNIRTAEVQGELCVAAIDLADPMGVSKSAIRNLIAKLDPADRHDGVILNDAIGRPQETVVLTEVGYLQVISQGRKEESRKILRFMAQITAAWRRGQLAAPSLDSIRQLFGEMLDERIARLNQTPVFSADSRRKMPVDDLPEWTDPEYLQMKRRGYIWIPDFLFIETGEKAKAPTGVTKRVLSYCKQNKLSTYPYRFGQHVRVLVPVDAAKLVYRSGWTVKKPVDVMRQWSLDFGRMPPAGDRDPSGRSV